MSSDIIRSDCGQYICGVLLILLSVTLSTTAQRGPEPASAQVETKTGAITGRVVNENGQPHVNVDVFVRPITSGLPNTQTITNRDGVFKLSGLDRGSYYVSAAVPGHIPKTPAAGSVVFKDGDVVTLVLAKGGVVTGTVTDQKGEPVIGIGVRVQLVTDESGRTYDTGRFYENTTDDRGVYRVYGIPTGTYVVSADGSIEERSSLRASVNGFAKHLPTYAPSSNREGADQISVRPGEEASNVDIRYRGERGSTISGIVNGLHANHRGYSLSLTSIVEGGPRWSNQFQGDGEFAFNGIPDGDYHLAAMAYWNDSSRRLSESIVLKVRGADIEGIELTTSPMASIDARVVLERLKTPPPQCTDTRQPQFSDTSVTAWQRVAEGASKKPQFVWRAGGPVTPNAEGRVALSNVPASEYYFAVRFSGQQWFLQSIAFPPPTPGGKAIDATRTWTTVKPGDQLSGLTFTLAQGAGFIRGKVSLGEGQTLPQKTVAFLVPAEPASADELLRYYAAPVNSAGNFWLNNVAPGRYWILAQQGTDDTRYEVSKVRLPDGAEMRTSLRHAAEKKKTEIEIKPCDDVTFRLPL